MKIFILLELLTFSFVGQAAVVQGTRVNTEASTLEVLVSYIGGCEAHKFTFELTNCHESLPVICFSDIKEDTQGDICVETLTTTLVYSLKDLGFNDEYYSEGSLEIRGESGKGMQVILPKTKFNEVYLEYIPWEEENQE